MFNNYGSVSEALLAGIHQELLKITRELEYMNRPRREQEQKEAIEQQKAYERRRIEWLAATSQRAERIVNAYFPDSNKLPEPLIKGLYAAASEASRWKSHKCGRHLRYQIRDLSRAVDITPESFLFLPGVGPKRAQMIYDEIEGKHD